VCPSRNVFKFGGSCIASECDNGGIAYTWIQGCESAHDPLPKYPYTMTITLSSTNSAHPPPSKNPIHSRSSPKQGMPKTHMSRPVWVAPGPCASRSRCPFRNEKRPRQSRLARALSTPLLTCRFATYEWLRGASKDMNIKYICVSAKFIECVDQERIVCWTTIWHVCIRPKGSVAILHNRPPMTQGTYMQLTARWL
jgi:hypothetical protein